MDRQELQPILAAFAEDLTKSINVMFEKVEQKINEKKHQYYPHVGDMLRCKKCCNAVSQINSREVLEKYMSAMDCPGKPPLTPREEYEERFPIKPLESNLSRMVRGMELTPQQAAKLHQIIDSRVRMFVKDDYTMHERSAETNPSVDCAEAPRKSIIDQFNDDCAKTPGKKWDANI